MANATTLKLPTARGTVTVETGQGIFFKVLHNGTVLKRRKGAWHIPLRNGSTGQLRVRGFLPGLQRLYFDGVEAHNFGEGVTLPERIVLFVPFTLVIFRYVGAILAVVLFFMALMLIKNKAVPRPMRIATPIVNTLAAGALLWILASQVNAA